MLEACALMEEVCEVRAVWLVAVHRNKNYFSQYASRYHAAIHFDAAFQ